MGREVFKYLIPVYLVLWVVLAVSFFAFTLSQGEEAEINVGAFFLVVFGYGVLILAGLSFLIYMIVDCASRKFRDDSERVIWILVLLLLNTFGAIIYYYVHGKNPKK